ncbi:MAG: phage scaffolding protein [Fusobacteriaceae bacterium]
MKWLRTILEAQGIESDTVDEIVGSAKKQKLIPKERFDEVNTEFKETKEALGKVNTELETLKGQVKDNEALTKQISDLQEANTKTVNDYESKLKEIKIKDYVKGEMSKELKDSKYFDLLYKEVDQSKIVIAEDGSISGFDIATIKENYTDLFNSNEPGNFGNPPRKGLDPGKDDKSFGKELAKLNAGSTSSTENPYF